MTYRILVTGSRNHTDLDLLSAALHSAHIEAAGQEIVLVHGGARGLDALAGAEAQRRGWRTEVYPAAWNAFGKRAGPTRNQAMVDAGADVCLAFPNPDSVGTWDCVRRARSAQIPVVIFEDQPPS